MDSDDENTSLLSQSPRSVRVRSPVPPGISPIVSEDEEHRTRTVRMPVQYYSIRSGPSQRQHDERTSANMHRYKYYNKLATTGNLSIIMPNHIVPPEYFLVVPIKVEPGTQSSIITIFSIWNTMMGTSILSMPWALQKAGFAMGICTMVFLAAVTLYTAYRIMKSPSYIGNTRGNCEFTDVCAFLLGRPGEIVSVVFSILALTGAAIVYWVLMSNFLYNSVKFIYEDINGEFLNNTAIIVDNKTYTDVVCPHPDIFPFPHNISANTSNYLVTEYPAEKPMFYKVWNQTRTVPFFLILVLGPLMNIKSPTFFTKFNALGTVAVAYIVCFVTVKAANWGFHVEFHDELDDSYISQFEWTFPALSGILALAYFIHNCVLSIVKNQKHPENNGRDLTIAFFLVMITYVFIGSIFYLSFPLKKTCIEDNLLNNFATDDIMAFAARIFLFFQMVTVFPLLCYIYRIQVLGAIFGKEYPGMFHVLVVNLFIVSFCLIFAIFLPQIGTIIRFSGAMCGFVYIFTLPSVVYLLTLRHRNIRINFAHYLIHIFIILVGFSNFVAQFFIIGK